MLDKTFPGNHDKETLRFLNSFDDSVEYCSRHDLLPMVVHLPCKPAADVLAYLLSHSGIVGFSSGLDNVSFEWQQSGGSARAVVVIAPRGMGNNFSFHMAKTAFSNKVSFLVRATATGWNHQRIPTFLAQRFVDKIRWVTGGRFIRRPPCLSSPPTHLAYQSICATRPSPCAIAPVPGRILLFNNSLAWGGAERQTINTLTGLARCGLKDLRLLCNYIHSRPAHDFYLHHLQKVGIPAEEISQFYSHEEKENLRRIDTAFRHEIASMPEYLNESVIRHSLEIMRLRPTVVHAWQDATSIVAGLSALIAGVPRIVLGGRNMAPHRFAYFQPWMHSAYRALTHHPDVVMINNSSAGARDYEKWLGLPEGHIRVLFNGADAENLVRSPPAEIAAYRKKLGISEDAKLVGSIFRLYPEKDPMLWVETAALVAAKHPDAAFLVIGDGPLLKDMGQALKRHGLDSRFFLPGTEKNNALALSALDVFMLSSRFEGTPNVCIEAQWLGIPVVSTDAGGSADTFDDGKTGFLVSSRKAEDLAGKISFILGNPAWAKMAVENAPAFVQGRFGMERMISETLDVYGLGKTTTPTVRQN